MASAPNVIEVTAGETADELKRWGINSDERVTLTIEPERELIPGSRVRGLSRPGSPMPISTG
jgi:hypothetical protein